MKKLLLTAVTLPLLLVTVSVSAATFRTEEKNLSIASPSSSDLYAVSNAVEIIGDVTGDLFVAGGSIDVRNRVTQSIFAAGQTVNVQSQIGDDLRVAGNNVTIRGVIAGDLIVFGSNIVIGKDAIVLCDLIAYGSTVTVRGTVGKNVTIGASEVSMEGVLHGNASISGESVTISGAIDSNAKLVGPSLTIAKGASFRGKIDYWTPGETVDWGASLENGQKPVFHPEYKHDEWEVKHKQTPAFANPFSIFGFLSSALVILLLTLATKTYFADAAKLLQKKPWKSFLVGLLFLLVTPLIALLLFITFIGIPLGFLAIAVYLIVLFFSPPITAMILSRWTAQRYAKDKWNTYALYGVSLGFVLVLQMITIVPYLGWLVRIGALLLGIGALLITKSVKWKKIA